MTKSWSNVWNFRNRLYGSLGNIILDPIQEENKEILTHKFWRNFPLEIANPILELGLDQLMACTSKLEKLSTREAIEMVQVEYTELFLGPGIPKAPLYESFYRSNKKLFFGPATFEMKKVLQENNLESRQRNKQPEDHLGLELLFIAVQTEQMNVADQEKCVSIVKNQISFIKKHLLSWIPELCNDAKGHGNVGFYAGLFDLILGTLLWDIELLEEFVKCHEEITDTALGLNK